MRVLLMHKFLIFSLIKTKILGPKNSPPVTQGLKLCNFVVKDLKMHLGLEGFSGAAAPEFIPNDGKSLICPSLSPNQC